MVVRPPRLVAVKSVCPVVKTYPLSAAKVCLASVCRPALPKLCAVRCKARWPAPWELVGALRLAGLLKGRCA